MHEPIRPVFQVTYVREGEFPKRWAFTYPDTTLVLDSKTLRAVPTYRNTREEPRLLAEYETITGCWVVYEPLTPSQRFTRVSSLHLEVILPEPEPDV